MTTDFPQATMYYLVHLAFPAVVALLFVAITGSTSLSLLDAIGHVGQWYLVFALPHMVWSAISSYFDAKQSTAVGGFIGAHILLIGVLVVLPAMSSWQSWVAGIFLYIPIAPVAVALGAIVGRKYFQQLPSGSARA
jgi:hypothetical protein